MKERNEKIVLVVLSIIILFVAIFPLLKNQYPWNHDLNLYPTWLYEFDQGIKEGQLLPRWSLNFWLGFGAPLFNFIQPLFYYLAELFHLVGLGLVNSVKMVIALGFILGFWGMYLFGKEIWGKEGGFLTAVIYTFFPYRLGLVYLRGDFAEFLATAFIPLILFSFFKLGKTKKLSYFLLSSLSLSLLFLTHNIQTLLFLPVLFSFLLVIFFKEINPVRSSPRVLNPASAHYKHLSQQLSAGYSASNGIKRVILPFFLSCLLGIGLASLFTLPAFWERKFLEISKLFTERYDFHNNFLNILDLIIPFWNRVKFFQIGTVGIIIIFFTIYLLFRKKVVGLKSRSIYFFFVLLVLSLLATLPASTGFWENVPLVKFVQFPWRTLSFAGLALGILGGLLLSPTITKIFFKKDTSKLFLVIIFSTVIVLANVIFARPTDYLKIEEDRYYNPIWQIFSETNLKKDPLLDNTWNVNTYSIFPVVVPQGTNTEALNNKITKVLQEKILNNQPIPRIDVLQGEVVGEITQKNSYHYYLKFDAKTESQIRFNNFWFPGWRAYLDGSEVAINHANEFQAMVFDIPFGSHALEIKFTNTPIRKIGELVSAVSFLVWLSLLITWSLKKYFYKSHVSPQITKPK